MENMFSISFRKHHDEKKKQLVYFDNQNVIIFAQAISMSTAHASTVFLLNYNSNTIFKQSALMYDHRDVF